ncbi:MAG TPA: hypothetical protein VE403_01510, partial [Sphingomicrobium sp.]|nr:hypothetical protein [Sphingomicrobium sp.]
NVRWPAVPNATDYIVRWRRTDASQWENARRFQTSVVNCARVVGQRECLLTSDGSRSFGTILDGIRVDDWVFGVSSVSADGFESPVASAVPGGAFKPYVKPAEAQ